MFLDIPSNPAYQVNSDGIIRSKPMTLITKSRWEKNGGILLKNKQSKVIKPYSAGAGYMAVRFGMGKPNIYVHRLVAEVFCNKPDGATEVNHIDGDKTNNAASNLEWVTKSQNQKHSTYVLGNTRGQF